jgi:hypothetical protein
MALRSKEYYRQDFERVLTEHKTRMEPLYARVNEASAPAPPPRLTTEYAWLAGQLQGLVEGILRDAPEWEVTET